MQPSQHLQQPVMQPRNIDFVGCFAALAHDERFNFFGCLLNDFFDSGRVNPTVTNQRTERLTCDLAPDRIETANDHYPGGVIDDHIDTGRFSNARMFRPSLPMIRPFISSFGMSTVLVVDSAV